MHRGQVSEQPEISEPTPASLLTKYIPNNILDIMDLGGKKNPNFKFVIVFLHQTKPIKERFLLSSLSPMNQECQFWIINKFRLALKELLAVPHYKQGASLKLDLLNSFCKVNNINSKDLRRYTVRPVRWSDLPFSYPPIEEQSSSKPTQKRILAKRSGLKRLPSETERITQSTTPISLSSIIDLIDSMIDSYRYSEEKIVSTESFLKKLDQIENQVASL